MGLLDAFIKKEPVKNIGATISSNDSPQDDSSKQDDDLAKLQAFEKKLEKVKVEQEAAAPGDANYISESVMSKVDQALSLKNPFRGE